MTEIEKAIVFVKDIYKAIDPTKSTNLIRIPDERVFNLHTIITTLREKAEREKGCFWCSGDIPLDDVKINDMTVTIGYCPMCGKAVGNEAIR